MDSSTAYVDNRQMAAIETAVFGAGNWARRTLLPALTAQPEVTVVGCVDAEPDRAKAVAAEFGVPDAHRTLDELFAARDGLGLLVVAAPDHLHVPAARAALARGVAVYCEKPVGNSAAAVDELAGLAESAGVPATVGYAFRYSSAVQALCADLRTGVLGDVWLIELFEHNPQFHPVGGEPMNWKGDPDRVVAGALLEYGSHVLDLCQWLLGPIASVSADLVRVRPDAGVDDVATLQLRFARGASGTLLCGWVLAGGYPGITIRLHTSAGLAEVHLGDLVEPGERYVRRAPDGTELSTAALSAQDGGPTGRQLADLIATLRGAPPSPTLPTLRDAALTHRVIAAALCATERWQPVT